MSKTSHPVPPTTVRLLLLGYGHVAQAFLPLLAARSAWLERNLGVRPVISGIGSRSHGLRIYSDGIDASVLAQQHEALHSCEDAGEHAGNAEEFIQGGKAVGATILVELTTLNPQSGQPALNHIRGALQAGMDVITANKGPIAYAQAELQSLAQQHNVQLRFESTVMDGLPIFNLAQFTLQAAGIQSFRALLNATSSLVLSMIEQGYSREEAMQRAQELGIAEADPWHDLDGWDAVMKTTILANTLLEGRLSPHMVKRAGIRDLPLDDIRAAMLAGSPIRLVSQASRRGEVLTAEVQARNISTEDILYVGKGTSSVISLETEAMGTITLVEHETATSQTAYGVLSDLITILQQRRRAQL
jgi:homoserine dehydrogenase